MNRAECLQAAHEAVSARPDNYGSPAVNFTRIARLWSVIAEIEITPERVALMMIALKVARLMHDPRHLDGWIDAVGYAACGAEVATGDQT